MDIVPIVPSDHVILSKGGFQDTLKEAPKISGEEDKIVTIGISPTFLTPAMDIFIEEVKFLKIALFNEFKEKPDFDTAKTYLETGEYFWNAGMFVSSLKTLREELKTHSPEIYAYFDKLNEAFLMNQSYLKFMFQSEGLN